MTSDNQTLSCQMSMCGQHLRKRATFSTSEGNSALLPASARDQTVTMCGQTRDQTVTKGDMIMMRLMFISSARCVFETVFSSTTKKDV